MSGVGEAVAIIACVAAIVSAYKDGRGIVKKIRERRTDRQAPPPTFMLDESLTSAAEGIEVERKHGVSRLGPAFEKGDDIALMSLYQIKLQLEAQLFRQLAQALQDDSITDFDPALVASDQGRDETITTLMDLRKRLMVAAPIDRLLTSPSGTAHPYQPVPLEVSSPSPTPSSYPWDPTRFAASTSGFTMVEANGRSGSSSSNSISYLPSYGRGLRFWRKGGRQGSDSSSNDLPEQISNVSQASSLPDQTVVARTLHDMPGPSRPLQSRISYLDDEDPEDIWGDLSTAFTVRDPAPERSPCSPQQSNMLLDNLSNHSFTKLPVPTADNGYLGFCKGAWKLQCGAQDALKKRLEFNSGWSSSEVPYLACSCSRCVFAYHLPLENIEQVRHSKTGVSFRWRFLAKSHVEQSRTTGERYVYQCLFCVLTGEQQAVWHGVDPLLDHVCMHRGQSLPPEVLHRTKCIVDRVASEAEDFDINLRPSGKEMGKPREDSIFEQHMNPWR